MDKLSELNELIEDMEAVADKYYRKMKEESSDYLEVKEKYERTARAVAYRDSSEMGRFYKNDGRKIMKKILKTLGYLREKNNPERGEKMRIEGTTNKMMNFLKEWN